MKVLHQDASQTAYRFICLWVFGIWFGYILFDPMPSLAQYPKSLYFPTGFLLKYLPQNMFYLPVSCFFLVFLKTALLLGLGAVLLGFHKKWAGLCVCVLLTVFEGIVRSFGHINHPELVMLFAAFALVIFFFFEDTIVLPAGISKYGVPLIAILFIVCFTYCFAGIHRLISRGAEIYGTNTITYWVIQEGKRSRMVNWHLENLMLTNPWVNAAMRWGFPLVTFFEISAPFCMISRPFRYLWLLMMVPFHILVWLFMGIFFWANMGLYVLLFDITKWLRPACGDKR